MRNGVVAVVYKEMNDTVRYAVLKRVKNWEGWELVKGHRDTEETVEEAAAREVEEETGITEHITIEALDVRHEWEYEHDGTRVEAKYDAVVVQVPESAHVNVSANPHDEHADGYFLNKRDTVAMLTYDDQKRLVKQVHEQLTA